MPMRLGPSLALGGGGAAPFTPLDLGAALVSWHRADAGVTLNGTTVSSWADQSGNGRTFSQATASRQPLYEAAGFNSLPSFLFDGTTDWMSMAHPTVLDGSTGMVVALSIQPISRAAYWGVVYMRDGSNGFVLDNYNAAPGTGWRFVHPGGGSWGEGAFVSNDTGLLPCVIAGQFNNKTNVLYKNGSQIASKGTTGSTIVGNTQPIYLGAALGGTSPASIRVREVVIASTGLATNDQLAKLQTYLMQRSGL